MKPIISMTVIIACLTFAVSSHGEMVDVDLSLTPATEQSNRMNITLSGSFEYMGLIYEDDDSQSTDLSGNMLATLTVDFNPSTFALTVTGLEFTGGRVAATDTSFSLDASIMGGVDASFADLAMTLDTPVPPSVVTAGTYAGSDHSAIVNEGTADVSATGILGGLFSPITVDFSTTPMTLTTTGQGTIDVSAPVIVGYDATYVVTLVQPVAMIEVFYDDGSVRVETSGGGVITGVGEITVPEPATALTLAGMLGLYIVVPRRGS